MILFAPVKEHSFPNIHNSTSFKSCIILVALYMYEPIYTQATVKNGRHLWANVDDKVHKYIQ